MRLRSLCEARFPLQGVAPDARIFRHVQQARCVDGLLATEGGAISGVAPYSNDFRAELRQDPPEGVGLPLAIIDVLIAETPARP